MALRNPTPHEPGLSYGQLLTAYTQKKTGIQSSHDIYVYIPGYETGLTAGAIFNPQQAADEAAALRDRTVRGRCWLATSHSTLDC